MTEPTDASPSSSDEATAPSADTEPTAAGVAAPAKKAAPRKRAPRKRAPAKKAAAALAPEVEVETSGAPAVTPVEQPVEPPLPAEAGEVTPAEAGAAAELPPAAEPEPTPEPTPEPVDPAEEDEEADAPRAAVLFQPPTTPRRRRRAATAPAGPPVLQDAPEPVAEAPTPPPAPTAVTFDAPAEPEPVGYAPAVAPAAATTGGASSDQSDQSDRSDNDDSDDDGGGRRRRRGRRGRGRRTPGGDDDANETTDSGSAIDRPAADATPAVADAEGPATDAAGPDGRNSDNRNPDNRNSDGRNSDGRTIDSQDADDEADDDSDDDTGGTSRRRRRRRRRGGGAGEPGEAEGSDPPNTVVHVREPRAEKDSGGGNAGGGAGGTRRKRGERATDADDDGVRGVRGSTRLEAKRQRRRDGRDTGRRRAPILTESEFLARREAVERVMAIRQHGDRTQIGVLEDDVLVEHYVTRASATSYVGNVYLGRVQNVLPSMEAAFIDIGKGRNGVLYAGEVNWDAAGLDGKSRHIEQALHSGDSVLVQVTKDPVGHKGARLTSQVSLPGRYLVYVPGGGMTGISRRLPDTERSRLKAILKKVVPEDGGVIVRTAAEGASEEDLARDVERLVAQWESIQARNGKKTSAPELVHGEPDLAIRVVRDVFNEDVTSLLVQGEGAYAEVSGYLADMAPELADRVTRYTGTGDLFHDLRIDEQLAKALDRKVWLPSGGSLVIDRTEAMTVVDVNTGKYIGSGGNLEETVTRNNLEAAEEIVRQLRLRDVGGIVVIDFIDMVLESNRDLVLRRLTECLGRDRTKHQVAEVTSLGLVQMTRKRVGEGLLEAFSTTCEHCHGRGVMVSSEPVDTGSGASSEESGGNGGGNGNGGGSGRRRRGGKGGSTEPVADLPVAPLSPVDEEKRRAAAEAMAAMARTAAGETGPVGDLAASMGEDAFVSSISEAVHGAVAVTDAPVDADSSDPDDVIEERAEAEAAAEPVVEQSVVEQSVVEQSVVEQSVVEQSVIGASPEESVVVAEPEAIAAVEAEAFIPEPEPEPASAVPAKKAAPRRRRAARRPAGSPEVVTPGAGDPAGTG